MTSPFLMQPPPPSRLPQKQIPNLKSIYMKVTRWKWKIEYPVYKKPVSLMLFFKGDGNKGDGNV